MAPAKKRRRAKMRRRQLRPELNARLLRAQTIRKDKESNKSDKRMAKLRKQREVKKVKQQEQRVKENERKRLRTMEIKVRMHKQRLKLQNSRRRDKVRRAKMKLDRLASRLEAKEKAKEKANKAAYDTFLKRKHQREKLLLNKKGARANDQMRSMLWPIEGPDLPQPITGQHRSSAAMTPLVATQYGSIQSQDYTVGCNEFDSSQCLYKAILR